MRIKNVIKVVLGILAAILLGAIGSGVWEKVLSPSISYIGKFVTSTISSLSSSYSDSIYKSASNISYSGQSGALVLILFLFVFFGLFIFALNSKKENNFIAPFYEGFLIYYRGWTGIIFSGALLFFMLFMISIQISILDIQRYSLKQMDILRPYIGEQEFHKLRSDYLIMKNKNDFNEFLNSLHLQSLKVNIDIDEYINR